MSADTGLSLDSLVEKAVAMLRDASHLVVLTGAGISTPSGIPDFRSDESGLWNQADPFEVASIQSFRRRPQSFYDWLRPLLGLIMSAEPNPAHLALAQMENSGLLQCVITQNIDGLHRKAGSHCVHEVHGDLREATCLNCFTEFDGESILVDYLETGEVPRCAECGGVVKPNVILLGELLPVAVMAKARKQAVACDLMLVVGSSLEMAPAGELPLMAKRAGARLIFVNLSSTPFDNMADMIIQADAAEILPRLTAPFVGH